MPSIQHESPIEIIRQRKELSAELVRLVTPFPLPRSDEILVESGANDASDVVPTEYTADMVTLVRDRVSGKPLLVIVIEPQGRSEEDKRYSWPAYLTNLRRSHRCDSAVLIVICWSEAEARKCREAIPLGHPGLVLVPIVIGPSSAPDLTRASSWLIILCAAIGAIRLDTDQARRGVLDAISATTADGSTEIERKKLTTLILAVAPKEARLELEALMETVEYRSEFIEGYEARAQARGEAIGQAIGQARGEAKALGIVLKARGLRLTDEQQVLVDTCTDAGTLELWLDRAGTADTADDVFKE